MDKGTGPETVPVLVVMKELDAAKAMTFARERTHDNLWWRWRVTAGCKYLGEIAGVDG